MSNRSFRSSVGRCTIPTSQVDVNACTAWRSSPNSSGVKKGPLINMHYDFGYFGGIKGVCCRDWSDIAATPKAVYGTLKPMLQVACPLGLEDIIPEDQFKFTVKGKLKKIPLRQMICPSDWSAGPMNIPSNPADVPDLDTVDSNVSRRLRGLRDAGGCQSLPTGSACAAGAYLNYQGANGTLCCDTEQSLISAKAANNSMFDVACRDYDFWAKQTQTNGSWEALQAEMCSVPDCYNGWSATNPKSLLPSGLGGALTVTGSTVNIAQGTGTPFNLVPVPGATDPRFMLVAANGFIGEMSDGTGMQFLSGEPDFRALMVYLECLGGSVLLRTPTGGVLTAATYTSNGTPGSSLYVDYGPIETPDIDDTDASQDDIQIDDNIPADADNIAVSYAFILAGAACSPPCQHGGTCVNSACSCPAGWGGADCGSCTKQCFNGGACSNTTGACVCVGMYGGDDCSKAVPFMLQLVRADGTGYNRVGIELRAGALAINMHAETLPAMFSFVPVGDGVQYYIQVHQTAFDGSHYPPTFSAASDTPIYLRTGPPNYSGESEGYVYVTTNLADANKFTINNLSNGTFSLMYTMNINTQYPPQNYIVGDNGGFNMNSWSTDNTLRADMSNVWRAVLQ